MKLEELEQDVNDYQKVKDEAWKDLEEATEWDFKCFERLWKAKFALVEYKRKHGIDADKPIPF